MAEDRDLIAQINAIVPYTNQQEYRKTWLDMANPHLTPQERKLFVAMSDLASVHTKITTDPSLAKKMYVAMATRTYRVQMQTDGKVNVSSWGLAKDVEDTYDSVDDLPDWMQRKIATLMIFDPAQVNEEIKGLGRRISKGTFWLYPDEGEDDGNDARAPSQDEGA